MLAKLDPLIFAFVRHASAKSRQNSQTTGLWRRDRARKGRARLTLSEFAPHSGRHRSKSADIAPKFAGIAQQWSRSLPPKRLGLALTRVAPNSAELGRSSPVSPAEIARTPHPQHGPTWHRN